MELKGFDDTSKESDNSPMDTSLEKATTSGMDTFRVRLLEVFLSGRSRLTVDAYRRDLQDFQKWTGASTPEDAVRELMEGGHGPANETAFRYRASLMERELAPATVNRKLAALRSVVKLARTFGLIAWSLEVPGVESRSYRDTKGPGPEGYRRLLSSVDTGTPKGLRDHALLHLLFDLALRREEAVSLDVEHVNLEAGTVSVLGKKRTERERLTLPVNTQEALRSWLMVRGTEPGPLFQNLDRAGKGDRLTGRSVHRLVGGLGTKAGLGTVRPHGLRHAAITEALEATGGDIRSVQKFSRHRDIRTLVVYDDSRRDMAGDVARLLAGRTYV